MQTAVGYKYKLFDRDLMMRQSDSEYVLKVRDLPADEKPREKMAQFGPDNLTIAELISILLGVGTKKEEVMSMAKRILKQYGETAIMHETNPQKLSDVLDIPVAKASQIIAGFELGRRYFDKRAGQPVYIHSPLQAYQYFKGMAFSQKEQLRGLYLNSRYQAIHDEVISVGSLTANIVHPREVFRPALEHSAVAVIVAHNHPSGSLEATDADKQVTNQLQAAGQVLGIDLIDHLIITRDSFASIIE